MRRFQGFNLKLLRRKNKESLTDLSEIVGIDRKLISDWENERKQPTESQASLLAYHYNVNPYYFYQSHDEQMREACLIIQKGFLRQFKEDELPEELQTLLENGKDRSKV